MGIGGEKSVGRGDARVKAAREMPRPCVAGIAQAQGTGRFANNRLTKIPPRWELHC